MVEAERAVGVPFDGTLRWSELSTHELKQGALPTAVGANECHTRLAIDTLYMHMYMHM